MNRDLIESGRLKHLIDINQVTGILCNVPIFAARIAGDHEYRDKIQKLVQAGMDAEEIYQNIVVEDVKSAADFLMPVFQKTEGRDGFAGIPVSPEFAYDVEALIEEGQRLWEKINRPNIMIQIPATGEAVTAVKDLLQSGINVNATLIYSLSRYREVALAYVEALRHRLKEGGSVHGIASAATFSAHPQFNSVAAKNLYAGSLDLLWHISASTALSSKKIHREIFENKEFLELAERGAQAQMLMWLDETDSAQTVGGFGCALDLSDPSAESAFDMDSSSENEDRDMDWLLDLLQEQTVKLQVVQVDAALETIRKHCPTSSQ